MQNGVLADRHGVAGTDAVGHGGSQSLRLSTLPKEGAQLPHHTTHQDCTNMHAACVPVQMMRKMKTGKSLDARHRMLLDDAAFACVPPATIGAREKARPPLQAYLRHLVLHRLWVDDPKKVRLRLLPAWAPTCMPTPRSGIWVTRTRCSA